MTLNGTPGNGQRPRTATRPNGHSPNGRSERPPQAHERQQTAAPRRSKTAAGQRQTAPKDWAALSRVHGDFTADLGESAVNWSPADPDALALDNLLAMPNGSSGCSTGRTTPGRQRAGSGRSAARSRRPAPTGTPRPNSSSARESPGVTAPSASAGSTGAACRCVTAARFSDAADVAAEAIMHLRKATNGGRIRPVITVFAPDAPGRPGPRILSSQLVRYAGYENEDGTVIGDPANVGITRLAQDLGWRAATSGHRRPAAASRPVRRAAAAREGTRIARDHARTARRRGPRGRDQPPRVRVVRRPRLALARRARDQRHVPGDRRGPLPSRAVQRLVHGHRDRIARLRRRRSLRPAADDRREDGTVHRLRPEPVERQGDDRAQPGGTALVRHRRRHHRRPSHRVGPVPPAPREGGTPGPGLPGGLELDRPARRVFGDAGLPPVLPGLRQSPNFYRHPPLEY